jgi:hypothetical protein
MRPTALATATSMSGRRARRALYEEGYMAPPDFRCPGMWRLSASAGSARRAAIHRHFYEGLTAEERADPLWDPDNEDPATTS